MDRKLTGRYGDNVSLHSTNLPFAHIACWPFESITRPFEHFQECPRFDMEKICIIHGSRIIWVTIGLPSDASRTFTSSGVTSSLGKISSIFMPWLHASSELSFPASSPQSSQIGILPYCPFLSREISELLLVEQPSNGVTSLKRRPSISFQHRYVQTGVRCLERRAFPSPS